MKRGAARSSSGEDPDAAVVGRRMSLLDRALTSALGLFGMFALCASASSGWLAHLEHDHNPRTEAAVRLVCLVVALVCGTTAYRIRRAALLAEKPSSVLVSQPGMLWLADLQKSVASGALQHDYAAISSFIELITNPARHRSRVVENIDFKDRAIQQYVSVEVTLPNVASDERSPTLYLPVLQPIKGELIDKFALTDAAGSRLTNLSYEETTRLAALALRILLLDATGSFELGDDEKITELALLDIVARRGKTSASATEATVSNALKTLGTVDHDERTERLKSYLLSLSLAYPIVAVVPRALVVANRLLLRYERTIIPVSEHKGWHGDLRLGFGIRPNQVAIAPVLALTSGSYHLLINCPADKYVLHQRLMCKHCGKLVTHDWRGAGPEGANEKSKCCHTAEPPNDGVGCHYRLRRRRGQSYVHLYMRGYGQADAPMQGLQMLVQLKEVPPGSRGQAVVTAIATTVLIGTVGYLISHNEIVPNSDLPALALSLPAVAASWFGFTSDGDNLTGSSLLARLSLVGSGALSVIAIILYLSEVPNFTANVGIPPILGAVANSGQAIAFLGVTNSAWLVLLAISSINSVYILWRFAIKVRTYSAMLQKQDAPELEYLQG